MSLTKIIVFTFFTLSVGLQTKVIAQNEELNNSYKLWEDLLQMHVNDNGFVDYQGFINNETKLKEVTTALSKNSPDKSWSKNEKMAYLINTYNAFTVQLIVDNYPIESIIHIENEPFEAFKRKFIEFGGQMISLDDIEKNMLLPMGDPRVHFAVNCASISCPKLDNEAYKPENLDEHLDRAAYAFINSELNIIDENKVKLSKVFEWYKTDFENDSQNLIDFINRYSKTEINPKANIEYLDYDWNLNSK